MKKAFTLIEVNLAMLIMAGGILSLVGLYALGFRENRQSREDVAATALADSVMSPLVMALSSSDLKWTSFRDIGNYPNDNGWAAYLNSNGAVSQNPQSKAESVFSSVMGKLSYQGTYKGNRTFPSATMNGTGMSCALVVQHDEGSAVVRIGFRAVDESKFGQLLGMPLFYTEVRFQGRADL